LKNDESLLVNFAASRLRMEMDRVPLWRGNAVSIRQLVEDFGRYLYLPRLQTPSILVNAIRSGLALLTWERDAFAYAESFDESKSRYRGLQYGGQFGITSRKQRPRCQRAEFQTALLGLQLKEGGRPALDPQSRRNKPSRSVTTARWRLILRESDVTPAESRTR
jgi:hypothetical protein